MEASDPTLVTTDELPPRPDATRLDRLLRGASGVVVFGLLVLAVLGVRADLRRAAAWQPAVATLAKEVELQRGSRFLHPVPAEQASVAQIRAVRTERMARDTLGSAMPEGVAAALGLVAGPDAAAGALTLTVVYDEVAGRVLATAPVEELVAGVTTRRLLAAELTRALLHQVAPADEPVEGVAAFVRGVVVAGEVHRVANRLAPDIRDRALGDADGLESLAGSLGEPLVLSLATQGGLDLVDARLRRPPPDTSVVLDPFGAGTVVGGGLGPLPWFLALSTATEPVVALRAVSGAFAEDTVVRPRDGRPCVSAVLTIDESTAAAARAAFSAWVAAAPSERTLRFDAIAEPASITVEACAPAGDATGSASDPDRTRFDTAIAVAAAASFATLSGVVDHGLDPVTARCAALAAIEGMTPDQLADRVLIGRRTVAAASTACR